MDRGAWWATVHGVAKSQTRLSDFTFTFHVHALEKEMATHSSVLAWRVPGMGEPGGLPSVGSHRVGYDWRDLAAAAAAAAACSRHLINLYWMNLKKCLLGFLLSTLLGFLILYRAHVQRKMIHHAQWTMAIFFSLYPELEAERLVFEGKLFSW